MPGHLYQSLEELGARMGFLTQQGLLNTLAKVAEEAGELITARVSSIKVVAKEASLHPTTDLDLSVDQRIFETLVRLMPESVPWTYISEERPWPEHVQPGQVVFVVDPIDGTRHLLDGETSAGVSIACVRSGEVLAAVVYQPFTRELYSAALGYGTKKNGTRVRCTGVSSLGSARILVSSTEYRLGLLSWVQDQVPVIPCGSIALKLAKVAAGEAEGTFTRNRRSLWDVAAGCLLVRESGGELTDSRGNGVPLDGSIREVEGIVASNGALHDSLLDIVGSGRWPH